MGAPKLEDFPSVKKSDKPKPAKQQQTKAKKTSSGQRGARAMRREYRKLRMKLKRSAPFESRHGRPIGGIQARMSQIKQMVPSVKTLQ